MMIDVRMITEAERPLVTEYLLAQAGATHMVSRGRLYQCDQLPGWMAWAAGDPVGLLTFHVVDEEMEVLTLYVSMKRQGIGSRLLETAVSHARLLNCRRVWLITTNDNTPAIQFYKACGWQLAAIHENALDESRKLKPEIPLLGLNGVPIQDEWEFEWVVAR